MAYTWNPQWKLATFDHKEFAKAINRHRLAHDLEWKDVYEATGVAQSTLSRMQHGRYPDIHGTASLAVWAALNMADYVRVADGG